MKIKIKRVDLGFILLFVGLFLLTYYVREIFVPSSLQELNILSIAGMTYLLYLGIKDKYIHISNKILLSVSLVLLSVIFVWIQTMHSSKSFMGSARHYFSLIYPIAIIYLRLDEQNFARVFRIFLRCLDILIAVMFVMLIIDLLFNNAAIKTFANITHNSKMAIAAQAKYRHASIMGHFIPTAEIYCIFYIMHAIDMNRKKMGLHNVVYIAVSVIGVGFSGSKAALAVLFAVIVIFNIKKIGYIIASFSVVAIATFAGLLDTVINRFADTDLTTGRFDMIIYLIERVNLFPVIGHGANSSYSLNRMISWASAAFEFPAMMFSYEYGVVFTVIFFAVVFIVPLIILLKKKNYTNLFFLLLLDIMINTYNGIGLGIDYFAIYAVAAFFIINSDKIKLAINRDDGKKLQSSVADEAFLS